MLNHLLPPVFYVAGFTTCYLTKFLYSHNEIITPIHPNPYDNYILFILSLLSRYADICDSWMYSC